MSKSQRSAAQTQGDKL